MSYKEAHFLEPVPVLVVSLDIGRSTSGYAFSFKGSTNIQTGTTDGRLPTNKVPSVLLLNPDQKFHSFGYGAIENYSRLSESSRRQYHYIEHFQRSVVTSDKVTEKTYVLDQNDRKVNALMVYEIVIKYLKSFALSATMADGICVDVDFALWMLPIPDKCSDTLRHFLHEAATRAGIPNDRLRLVSECEAVTLFWQEHPSMAMDYNVYKMKNGEKFILIDMKYIIEIHVRNAINVKVTQPVHTTIVYDAGWKHIRDEVTDFVRDFLGDTVWETFQTNYVSCYNSFMLQLHDILKSFSTTNNKIFHIALESSLLHILETSGTSLEQVAEESPFRHLLLYDDATNRLFLGKRLIEAFFLPTIRRLAKNLFEIIESLGEKPVKAVVLHGGLSVCPYMREELGDILQAFDVTFVPDGDIAVAKGAVMMGVMQRGVQQRIARLSYGIPAAVPFIEGEHPDYLRGTCDGEDWCENVFMRIIERGQVLTCGDIFVLNIYSTALDPDLKHCPQDTLFMMSKLKNPKFCTKTDGCNLLGKISMSAPVNGWPKLCKGEIRLIVDESNFVMEIVNKTTGQIQGASMKFM